MSLNSAEQCEAAVAQVAALTAENQRLREALEEIENPIEFVRKRLKDGEQINGQYAVLLSQDHNYLKSIAKDALKEADYEPT